MKTGYRFSLLPALLIALFGCQHRTQNLKIIVTTDVHGSFFPDDINTGRELPLSLARVQSLIIAERSNPEQELVLLDNGDIIQGDPLVYYSSFEKPEEVHICARVLNYMNYDAATMGNHDIEAGHTVYDKLVEESEFPWLAANAVRTDNGEPYFQPYTILNKGGVKVAVLGLITPAIPSWLPPDIWSGMEFQDMVEAAAYWVDHISRKEKADLLVGLFHAGMDFNYNNQNAQTHKNENAVRLVAEQVSGFDIIFCGHDHHMWNEELVDPDGGKVLILGSRSKAREVAVADINLSRKAGKWIINKIEGINQETGSLDADPSFMEEFSATQNEVREYVGRSLGTIDKTISSREAFFGPSAFMDLIHQVQLDISGAQISFAAPLSGNAEISKGEIVVGDMFELYKYENLLYTMKLSGKEILGYLNYSYAGWFNTMETEDDHLILLSQGEQGRFRTSRAYYNFDSAMGLKYVVDVRKPAGQMVKILDMADGQPFDPGRDYLVAVNSYRGNGGGGHLVEGAGIPQEELVKRLVNTTTKDLRFYMMRWIEEKKEISPEASGQWTVVPANFLEKGKKKDYPILFKN